MFCLSKLKCKSFSKRNQAVTIIELLVGAVVFLSVGIGAYTVYQKTTQKAQEVQKTQKFSRELNMFVDKFRHQIENAVQLPNAQSTILKVARPSRCYTGIVDEPATELAWGVVPFPGRDMSAITSSFTSFDPVAATANETTNPNDGVRLVSIAPDSTMNYFVYQTPATQTLYTSTGTNPLHVPSPVKNLAIGDYAVVSDSIRKELIRVTNLTTSGSEILIEHSAAKSAWNTNFTTNIGSSGTSSVVGLPVIYKVNITTYALNTATQNLMVDNHILDDDFNASAGTFPSPGLKLKWQSIAPNVSKFQVVYIKQDDRETRTPQIGMPTKVYDNCANDNHLPNCDCENQLGNPQLKTVKAIIQYTGLSADASDPNLVDNTVIEINPTVLKKSLPFLGSSSTGCETSNVLWTTLDDWVTPNPACTNPYCICSDRPPPSLCTPGPSNPTCAYVGPSGSSSGGNTYGGGGSG